MRNLLIAFLLLTLTSCHVGRFFIYNYADLKDYKKFPSNEVQTGETSFRFLSATVESRERYDSLKLTINGKSSLLKDYLDEETKTVAFMIIRNDTILFEHYFEGYDEASIVPSFSVAKSVTSALVGIAIDEGYIESVHEPVTNYLPELAEENSRFDELTIEHLLNMRSGLKFDESSYTNPFSEIAKLYYGTNHLKQIRKTTFEEEPDEAYEYQSINTEILGVIVERATGMKLASYLEEKIWIPLGMEYDASWSVDSKKNQTPKAFCCINARARDYAKFGRLYLNDGVWNGQQIVSKDWVSRSTTPNLDNGCYQYQWYSMENTADSIVYYPDSLSVIEKGGFTIANKSTKNPGMWYGSGCGPAFEAIGILGQYIYVDPRKNLIMVRLGKKSDSNYTGIFKALARAL